MPWFKCDVGIATHPKVLTAGPLALAVQIRAICYAAQNLTDGFIPMFAVPLLTTGMDEIQLCIQDPGDGISLSESAAQIDWPSFMVTHGLWHEVSGGFSIHDYLQWNPSKKEIEDKRKKQSLGGMKGMKHRYGIENKQEKQVSQLISNDITSQSVSISYSSLNSSEYEFTQFWDAYPRKVGKQAAWKEWQKLKHKPAIEKILGAIHRAKETEQWKKENGQFIPHPKTWLHQGRWDDECVVSDRVDTSPRSIFRNIKTLIID